MKNLPIVALIGQTNAGKSSLLNRLARKNIAIVAREEGTTRDNVTATIDNRFLLIDTAGLKNPEDDFEAGIQDQIADAIDSAEVILFVVDSTKYFDHHDKAIAKSALRSKKPIFLLLNKSDSGDAISINEFRALGIAEDHILRTSATTGQGIKELKTAIFGALSKAPARKQTTQPDLKLALIGRPNVGKSSLFNSLGKKQQALVSSRQGTTRDVNRVTIKFKGKTIEILDTAGLRRPGKREVGIEKFSAIRTLAAIEEADVCALLVDGTEPHSKLDQTLAGQIVKAGKGIMMVITKTDLLDETIEVNTETHAKKSTQDVILDRLEYDFNFLPFAPAIFTSSETGKNVTKLFDLALDIDEARHHQISTSELNKILREAIASHPPAGLKNTHPKPKYIVQTDTCPPWFVIHGHDLGLMHWSYKRYLERKIRDYYPFFGTPIFLSFRSDNPKTRAERLGEDTSE